eukprot:CAMPEP_0185000408 /NCGR_PEP_ID=MMETSP1098-20130426/68069_1 /TAXON_ID=89044 /ORGANISM="Spumella elongata, Strain CCAP 955/1" /LENGTH=68 /DNA_ID=CAMNT_0027527575 /DNA_START=57 /DNA_END=261 /DNA_ORIENTATION=-
MTGRRAFHLSPGIASSSPVSVVACVGIGAACPLLELSRGREGLADAAGEIGAFDEAGLVVLLLVGEGW